MAVNRRANRSNPLEDGVARKHQPEDPWADTTFRPIAYYNYETGENWSRLTEVIANGGRLDPYGKEGQHGNKI